VPLFSTRMGFADGPAGMLYKDFQSQGDFEYVLQYAKQLDAVIWESAAKRLMFVRMDGHARVKEFVERRR
jgi:transcription initiation factor TFIIH subunit 4